jgi:hypothetical protein
LNDDAIIRSLYAEIGPIDEQISDFMLAEDLKAIVLRHVQDRDHGVVDSFADDASIVGGLTSYEVYSSECHGKLLSTETLSSNLCRRRDASDRRLRGLATSAPERGRKRGHSAQRKRDAVPTAPTGRAINGHGQNS